MKSMDDATECVPSKTNNQKIPTKISFVDRNDNSQLRYRLKRKVEFPNDGNYSSRYISSGHKGDNFHIKSDKLKSTRNKDDRIDYGDRKVFDYKYRNLEYSGNYSNLNRHVDYSPHSSAYKTGNFPKGNVFGDFRDFTDRNRHHTDNIGVRLTSNTYKPPRNYRDDSKITGLNYTDKFQRRDVSSNIDHIRSFDKDVTTYDTFHPKRRNVETDAAGNYYKQKGNYNIARTSRKSNERSILDHILSSRMSVSAQKLNYTQSSDDLSNRIPYNPQRQMNAPSILDRVLMTRFSKRDNQRTHDYNKNDRSYYR